jgi:hypothetical protein
VQNNLNIVMQRMEILIIKFVVFFVKSGKIDVQIIQIFMIEFVQVVEEKVLAVTLTSS